MKSYVSISMITAALIVGISCGGGSKTSDSTTTTAATHSATDHATPHWTYEGEAGPAHWGDLSEAFATCESGDEQSPINLVSASAKADEDALAFEYLATDLKLINNGHTIQVNNSAASKLIIGDKAYNLAQFHFHMPSEHTLDGEDFPAELHLVHKDASGALAVVGIFITVGAENATLEPVLDAIPAEINEEVTVPGTQIDIEAILPEDHVAYQYAGSLTTPPCSEGVAWNVLQGQITMSEDQLSRLQGAIHMNARPVQDLNGRELMKS